jgi:hypothetical protein
MLIQQLLVLALSSNLLNFLSDLVVDDASKIGAGDLNGFIT